MRRIDFELRGEFIPLDALLKATNTVFGLGSLLDPATEFGLERQSEDFGQTLGTWGVPSASRSSCSPSCWRSPRPA